MGVDVVSRKETIDTTTSFGKFMLSIIMVVQNPERAHILDRKIVLVL